MAEINCGCDEITPCPQVKSCDTLISSDCVINGIDLNCIGVLKTDGLTLSRVLKKLNDAICQSSPVLNPDYSGYDVACLAPVTNQQSWVEKISEYVCTLNTTINSNYVTLTNITNNLTNAPIGTKTSLVLTETCAELPSLSYVNGTTTLNQHLSNFIATFCDLYTTIQTRTDLSGNTWGSCLSPTLNVKTAIQNITDLLCVHSQQIASISTQANPCGKFDHYNFSSDFIDTVTSTNLCKNEHSVILDKSKLIKVSVSDTCDGYLKDKIVAQNGVKATVQTVTTTIGTYVCQYMITNTDHIQGISVDSVMYPPGSPIVVTNTTAITSYLNALGFGTFSTVYSGGQLTITAYITTGSIPQFMTIEGSDYNFVAVTSSSTSCEKIVIEADPNGSLAGTWQVPSYSGTYIASGSSPIKYRLFDGVTVRIKGKLNNSLPASIVTDQTVFVLPVGYRPLEDQVFTCANIGIPATVFVKIDTSGNVVILGTLTSFTNNNTYINISFDID